MKKNWTFWLVVAVISAAAAAEPFRSADELQRWLTYYYLKPRPELAIPSLSVLDKELQGKGRSLAAEGERGGLRTFYAQIFAGNEPVVTDLEHRLDSLPSGQQAFVRAALRRCATPACCRVLKEPLSPPTPRQPTDPAMLDDLWAAFFATGDKKYVREIIDVLPSAEVRGDVNRKLTGGAAQWSLGSNAYQHSRVLAICEEAAKTSTGVKKRLLEEIVERAKAERASNPPPEPK